MRTRILKAFLISLLTLAVFFPAVPAHAENPVPAAAPLTISSSLPAFSDFVAAVTDGSAGVVRGVYVPNLFAYKVVQQPSGKDAYVSGTKNVVTQFRMAAQYDVVGLLAHNYLAGASFSSLKVGQEVRLVYGDGQVAYYKITLIASYQAVSPSSASSDFIDLATNKTYTATQIFNQYYTGETHLTFQTCVAKDKEPSWGRLFIVAEPDETRSGK